MIKEIEIPKWVDKEEFNEWIENETILLLKHDEENSRLIVLTSYQGDSYTDVRVLRFFNIGNKTACSVDFEKNIETKKGIESVLIDIMKKFNFSNKK